MFESNAGGRGGAGTLNMLDINFIRQNSDLVREGTRKKQRDPAVVDRVLQLDEKRRELIQNIEDKRRRKKLREKEISSDPEAKESLDTIAMMRQEREEIKSLKLGLKGVEAQLEEALLQIPNPPAPDVPEGKDESENVVLRKWGEPQKFDFQPKDHLELGELLDVIDIKRAAKVSGSRFSYLKGDAVLLEFALIRLAFDTLTKEGFIPILPPVLIKRKSMQGMGYLEHGGEDEMYILEKDGLVLVGTSEQSIGPMHANEVFAAKDLPRRYLGFSTCFRREAGSYGKDTRGILRVHQFNKVEMFSFTRPENGDREHEYLLSLEEKLMQALNIPYQVVKMCTGDLGAPAARKYDLDAWMPGQGQYREVTSTSTTTDFQARRLNIKYKEGGKTGFVHMLNGTAFSERPLIAILENYQQKDGSVRVPEVLQEFVGKDVIGP